MKNRDNQYLNQLRDYYAEHGVFPSYSGIAKLVGLSTTSAVTVMVGRLKAAGYLTAGADRRLAPGDRFFERDHADESIRAGLPEAVLQDASEPIMIDRLLVQEPSRTVILRIQGESMREAGLLNGDRVVVKRGAVCKPGDIVVAMVDGEFTVKYLAKDDQGYFLKPGNPEFKDIRPKNELELYGRVTGMFRVC